MPMERWLTTNAQCKEGIDINHKGKWGYHPLLVSLANTGEPLYIVNRSGNRPSHEGAAAWLIGLSACVVARAFAEFGFGAIPTSLRPNISMAGTTTM